MPDNLAGASRASQHRNLIDQLGTLGESVVNFDFDLDKVESIVGQFIESVIQSIDDANISTTGKISDIRMEVEATEIKLYGQEYLFYVDKGVQGSQSSALAPNSPYSYIDKRPPIEPIISWLKRKRINLLNNDYFGGDTAFKELSEEEQYKKVAWAMSTNIFLNGRKPTPIFDKHIPALIDNMKTVVADFTAANLVSTIRNKYGNDVMNKPKK